MSGGRGNATVDPSVEARIQDRLHAIEVRCQVRVLYACESGSRAWGFPSRDSDYDVRFIYAHPMEHYLRVFMERQPDVIKEPIEGDLDINGWDIRKALGLMHRSNAAILEWLVSPIVYRQAVGLARELQLLRELCYVPPACAHHYLSLARRAANIFSDPDLRTTKGYLYALRPTLAALWVIRGSGPPPMTLWELLDQTCVNDALREEVEGLVAAKAAGHERDLADPCPALESFVARHVDTLHDHEITLARQPRHHDELDRIFRMAITGH